MTTQAAPSTSVTMSEPQKLSPMDAFRKDAFAMEREFARALPPHIPVERFMRVVTTAVQTSMASNFTNLLECDRRSLWQAAMLALAIGYRCGLDPACSDQWLASLHETIRDGAFLGARESP